MFIDRNTKLNTSVNMFWVEMYRLSIPSVRPRKFKYLIYLNFLGKTCLILLEKVYFPEKRLMAGQPVARTSKISRVQ